jgi:hypothetical protein
MYQGSNGYVNYACMRLSEHVLIIRSSAAACSSWASPPRQRARRSVQVGSPCCLLVAIPAAGQEADQGDCYPMPEPILL